MIKWAFRLALFSGLLGLTGSIIIFIKILFPGSNTASANNNQVIFPSATIPSPDPLGNIIEKSEQVPDTSYVQKARTDSVKQNNTIELSFQ